MRDISRPSPNLGQCSGSRSIPEVHCDRNVAQWELPGRVEVDRVVLPTGVLVLRMSGLGGCTKRSVCDDVYNLCYLTSSECHLVDKTLDLCST